MPSSLASTGESRWTEGEGWAASMALAILRESGR
jgi:hypothetical protein